MQSGTTLRLAVPFALLIAPRGTLAAPQVDTLAVLGGLKDAGGLVTHLPRAATFTSGGVFFVQDGGGYLISEAGEVTRIVDEGEGPGEIDWVRNASGTGPHEVRMWDEQPGRLTVLNLDSENVTTASLPGINLMFGYTLGSPTSDGRLITARSEFLAKWVSTRPDRFDRIVHEQDTIEIAVHDPADGSVATVGRFRGSDRYDGDFAPGHYRALVTMVGDRVAVGSSHSSSFVLIDVVGGGRQTVVASVAPREFDARLQQRLEAEFVGASADFRIGGQQVGSRDEGRAAVVDAAGPPDHSPWFDAAILSESSDDLWLRQVATVPGPTDVWRVVRRGGEDRLVELPVRMRLLAVRDDLIFGYTWDELDITTLLLLRLRPDA